jgi:hypothetical protein
VLSKALASVALFGGNNENRAGIGVRGQGIVFVRSVRTKTDSSRTGRPYCASASLEQEERQGCALQQCNNYRSLGLLVRKRHFLLHRHTRPCPSPNHRARETTAIDDDDPAAVWRQPHHEHGSCAPLVDHCQQRQRHQDEEE